MKFCILIFLAGMASYTSAQNVGVGLSNPTRAKMEVEGVAGAGATAGLFGTGNAGISFQRNWPTIGFNQYRDVTTPGSQGRYMATKKAAKSTKKASKAKAKKK